jgi:uncharacterized membrane protein
MEQSELLLGSIGKAVSLMLEFTSVICIIAGFVSGLYLLFKKAPVKATPLHRRVKLQFGGWLALALEFQLASDIVKTTTTPTYENLIQLAALAVIRTFLNYYLNKELKEEAEAVLERPEGKKAEAIV